MSDSDADLFEQARERRRKEREESMNETKRQVKWELAKLLVVIVVAAVAVVFGAAYLDYHLSMTTTDAQIESTNFWTEGSHNAYAAAKVTNVGPEAGTVCVDFWLDFDRTRRDSDCKYLESGETVTFRSSIHADGKSITREDIREMSLRKVEIEPGRESPWPWSPTIDHSH